MYPDKTPEVLYGSGFFPHYFHLTFNSQAYMAVVPFRVTQNLFSPPVFSNPAGTFNAPVTKSIRPFFSTSILVAWV